MGRKWPATAARFRPGVVASRRRRRDTRWARSTWIRSRPTRPLLQITPANYKHYADKLTAGAQAAFAKYPSFRMDIYPTRRSASFPERVYEYTVKNATACKLVADGDGIENCAEGFPFPIPQNAYEVIWNHKLKHKGCRC
jgi:hypothetical protein